MWMRQWRVMTVPLRFGMSARILWGSTPYRPELLPSRTRGWETSENCSSDTACLHGVSGTAAPVLLFSLPFYCLEFVAQHFMPNYFPGSPDFDEILANCTAELGQTVKLACKVTGVPKPAVTWYKGEAFPLWFLAMWSDIQRLFHEWICLLVGCRWTRSGGRSSSHHHRGPRWFLHTNPGQYDCRWFWSVHVLCHKSSWQCQYSGKDHSSG